MWCYAKSGLTIPKESKSPKPSRDLPWQVWNNLNIKGLCMPDLVLDNYRYLMQGDPI
ncbi:hypothetical protein MC7420_1822 [Coleofasciculus chthonoplastes PCC 7420]|uniref:Uncharacterized protein n=1 Tax=Coleofasciculus chthonoplastes PCC 7420 TaxID=118168 RepID=B4VMB9_9CYAN|nr:hypothetical protein MC7420_1822 [Coleofasciculus chthonoplastes PCC 7420]